MKNKKLFYIALLTTTFLYANSYKVVDTGQTVFFGNDSIIYQPNEKNTFFGQDASYLGYQFNYTNNKNGTISDNVTGLIWSKEIPRKLTFDEALSYSNSANIGGFNDWRIPTIKELYSLINFNGTTGSANNSSSRVPSDAVPYLDTSYFDFEYPKERRFIDAQYWTSTDYTSKTMGGNETFFGVNFADGRIKGYPKYRSKNGSSKYYLRLVRGNKDYGINKFIDNKDGTINDISTNLIWMKNDSKKGMNWEEALNYCENSDYAGITKWRLPNAKELQSLVDYSRSPDATNSASIDNIFEVTSIRNESAQKDYPFYWTSTTHLDGRNKYSQAVYISFGRALGYMKKPKSFISSKQLMDVHGAGAQRSDPKSGSASRFPEGRGPQGDVIRIDNYVRCVSDNFSKKAHTINIEKYEKKDRHLIDAIMPPYERSKKELEDDNVRNKALDTFDKNNDNKISKDEAPKMMKINFNKHDLDNDGFISKEELETLPKHFPRK